MQLENSRYAIDGMLRGVIEAFEANIKAEILQRVRASAEAELVQIADDEAARITKMVVQYYRNPMDLYAVLHYRLDINGVKVTEKATNVPT